MNLDEFKEEIIKLGIEYDEVMLDKLEEYYNLLVSWNQKMNLTAITDKNSVYLKHFYDSLTIIKVIDLNTINSLCDVGTGAGFPGIVLKIYFPHITLALVDSLGKRITFLKEVVFKLKLDNVEILNVRAEEYAKNVREKYDVVTARAVSSFNILLEMCIPLLNVGGYFVAMRGNNDIEKSSKALALLHSELLKIENFNLPIEDSVRTLALVKKNKKTDDKFPRRFSEIKKKPI